MTNHQAGWTVPGEAYPDFTNFSEAGDDVTVTVRSKNDHASMNIPRAEFEKLVQAFLNPA